MKKIIFELFNMIELGMHKDLNEKYNPFIKMKKMKECFKRTKISPLETMNKKLEEPVIIDCKIKIPNFV